MSSSRHPRPAPRLTLPGIASLVLGLLLASSQPARAEDIVSVDATATVVVTSIPPPKQGGRDLTYAFGKDVVNALRAEIEHELVDLRAFRGMLPEGGDYRLDVAITRVHRELKEIADVGESPNTMRFTLEASCSWSKGGEKLQDVPMTLTKSLFLDEAPGKRDLQRALIDLVHELAQRAFSELYEKRFFRVIEGGKDQGPG